MFIQAKHELTDIGWPGCNQVGCYQLYKLVVRNTIGQVFYAYSLQRANSFSSLLVHYIF
jgi:hypothetical protein